MTFLDVLWGTIMPLIGNCTSIILFIAPWKSVSTVKKNSDVGAVNGVPFIFMFFQCMMWSSFGFFIDDYLIVPVNALGAIFAFYYTLVFYGALKDQAVRFKIELGAVLVIAGPATLACVCFFILTDNDQRKLIFGSACNVVCVMFFASPLSTLADIVRQKDSSSLTWALTIAMIVNGCVWSIYGFYKGNLFILIPNALATGLGVGQGMIKACYPSKGGASDGVNDPLINPVSVSTNAASASPSSASLHSHATHSQSSSA